MCAIITIALYVVAERMAGLLTEKQQKDIERTWSLLEPDLQGAGFLIFKRYVFISPIFSLLI